MNLGRALHGDAAVDGPSRSGVDLGELGDDRGAPLGAFFGDRNPDRIGDIERLKGLEVMGVPCGEKLSGIDWGVGAAIAPYEAKKIAPIAESLRIVPPDVPGSETRVEVHFAHAYDAWRVGR